MSKPEGVYCAINSDIPSYRTNVHILDGQNYGPLHVRPVELADIQDGHVLSTQCRLDKIEAFNKTEALDKDGLGMSKKTMTDVFMIIQDRTMNQMG